MTSRQIGPPALGCLAVVDRLVVCRSDGPMEAPLRAQGPDVGTEAQRESGKTLYLKYCSQCHGEKGDGEGYATPHLSPGPATSRRASSRFGRLPTERSRPIRTSSTSSGAACLTPRCPPGPTCPTRKCRTSPTSSRPSLPTSRIAENVPKPMELPSAPASTNETIELGKKLYEENGCLKCHGTLGRGDGPSAPTLVDDCGHPIRAADLAQRWTFRGGSSREDIFRTMTTGLNGTPMPSFADALKPEQRWAITDFIASLSGTNGPGYTNLVVAKHVAGSDRSAKGAASFASAPVARFPIIGQIMEPGRAFHPPATSVTVQAIYDAESIALLVRWHDMSAEKTGKNGPSLPVPPEEEESEGGAAAAAPHRRRLRRPGSRPDPGRGGTTPLPSAAAPAGPAIRVLRRRRDPDSDAGADGRPQALLHLRRRPELRGSLVLRSGPPRSPSVHRPGKRGPRAERHGGCHGCRELRPGRMVGHLQAAPSRQRRAPRSRPGGFLPIAFSVWDGFSRERGNRRGLTAWYSDLPRAGSGPIGRRPDGEDGAAHSRHRAGRDRLGAPVSPERAVQRHCARRPKPPGSHQSV